MDQVPYLVLALGVIVVTLAQVFLSKSNPGEKLPLWWRRSAYDSPMVKLLRVMGVLLAILGMFTLIISENIDLNVFQIVGLVASAYLPFALVIVMHNARVDDH